MDSSKIILLFSIFLGLFWNGLCRGASPLQPVRAVAALNIGESQEVKLPNGKAVKLQLISVEEERDQLRNAVRGAAVKVLVDRKEVTLGVGNYNLPVSVGKVQIDCPEIDSHYAFSKNKPRKKALFRLWPKGSAYINPGTFGYPIQQAWFANMTQVSYEPTYVDWGESPGNKRIYYHAAHDFGGAEGMDQIVAATDGLVVGANKKALAGYDTIPLFINPDAVSVIDDRGWLIEYLHLDSTDPGVKLGQRIRKGQKIGMIGKQGTSGGWCHLHFEMKNRENLSGDWSTESAYPYLWEAYNKEYKPSMIAVARPHKLIWAGEEATLDGSKSRSMAGKILSYEWNFSDGSSAKGAVQKRRYDIPGEYSEILKVTDSKGNIGYDFQVIQVIDKDPAKKIPAIQAAYHPTLNIKAGDPVTFLVRTFSNDYGEEEWNFGDGTPAVKVKSETPGKGAESTKGKFAETVHQFAKPGIYIVTVARSNEFGYKATARLHVTVK